MQHPKHKYQLKDRIKSRRSGREGIIVGISETSEGVNYYINTLTTPPSFRYVKEEEVTKV